MKGSISNDMQIQNHNISITTNGHINTISTCNYFGQESKLKWKQEFQIISNYFNWTYWPTRIFRSRTKKQYHDIQIIQSKLENELGIQQISANTYIQSQMKMFYIRESNVRRKFKDSNPTFPLRFQSRKITRILHQQHTQYKMISRWLVLQIKLFCVLWLSTIKW